MTKICKEFCTNSIKPQRNTISIPKINAMLKSKDPIRGKLSLNNKTIIENVMTFNYIWAIISSSSNLHEEAHIQANKAARKSGYLGALI